jgi:hypothetical protein
MRTIYVLGSEIYVHSDYIIGHHHTLLKIIAEISILMMSLFVVLLVAVGIWPPARLVGLCGRVVLQSCWAYAWCHTRFWKAN